MYKIAVTSPSFSRNPILVTAITNDFPNVKLNTDGKRFSEEELITYIADYDAVIVGLDKITPQVISASPKLKYIAKYGVGIDNIDTEACKQRNIGVGITPGTNKRSVAELSLGNILSLLHNSYQASCLLSQGIWEKNGGFQLSEKIVGIIGVGNIGKELIKLLQPFNCKILVNDIISQTEYYRQNNLTSVDKETLYKEANVISIHTPLTPLTHHLINKKTIKKMQQGTILNNTARGEIIELAALKEALKENKILAALDVFPTEPYEDYELLSLPNLLCTPHIAGNAKEAVEAMGLSAINHLRIFFKQ